MSHWCWPCATAFLYILVLGFGLGHVLPQAHILRFSDITGCEFSGAQTLPALAAGEANSGGCVWGRQKSTWHAEAICGIKCA